MKNILIEKGYDPEPDPTVKSTWYEFFKSHWEVLATCDFFTIELLVGQKLPRDRNPLYTTEGFHDIPKISGVTVIKLPARSPNLNSIAERFVKSVKFECLNPLILSSVKQLKYVLNQYREYYHHERIHQLLVRIIEPKHKLNDKSEIKCIKRLD